MADVTFRAVSLQLRSLTEADLVEVRVEGRHHFYRPPRETLGPAREILERKWDDALWRLKLQPELEATRRVPRPRRRSQEKRKSSCGQSDCRRKCSSRSRTSRCPHYAAPPPRNPPQAPRASS